jgi:hypothetical protein
VKYTGDGADVSPPLHWSGVPQGAKELALIVEDTDAPRGAFTHWVAWGISPSRTGLPENVGKTATVAGLDGMRQGLNDARGVGYKGPSPPPGKVHHYRFTVYALKAALTLPASAGKGDLLAAMQGQILAQGTLTGTYQR